MLSATNISFSYDGHPALRDISFGVRRGDWLGLLGPNGSGKTTLTKVLCRLLTPQTGSVELEGKDLEHLSHGELAKKMAVVPQSESIIFSFSALEIVLMGRASFKKFLGFETKEDVAAAKKAMEVTDTWQFASRSILELSGGERQRVLIARALAQEPQILLMDEPTSFLDIKHQKEILDLLKELNSKGLTIISAMHDINLALLYCKTIMLLKNGGIFKTGRTEDIVTYANLKGVFDTEVYVGINDLNGKPYYLPY